MTEQGSHNEFPLGTELLTIKETAELLKVSRSTIYRLNKAGSLPILWVTERSPRIRHEDVLSFLRRQRYFQKLQGQENESNRELLEWASRELDAVIRDKEGGAR